MTVTEHLGLPWWGILGGDFTDRVNGPGPGSGKYSSPTYSSGAR